MKQSVGKKACLVGQALEINYFRGSNYLEVITNSKFSMFCCIIKLYNTNVLIRISSLVSMSVPQLWPEVWLVLCLAI